MSDKLDIDNITHDELKKYAMCYPESWMKSNLYIYYLTIIETDMKVLIIEQLKLRIY